jgi:holo-[acyl-carrier protein] synthase
MNPAVPAPPVRLGACRVGVDLVAVEEVEASVARFGRRYLGRVFTDHELDSCRAGGRLAGESLAARFAAKEAALKVLAPTSVRPEWRAIEVLRAAHGACALRLSGRAKELADQAGLGELAVSLTHEAGIAAAVVVATVREPPPLGPDVGPASPGTRPPAPSPPAPSATAPRSTTTQFTHTAQFSPTERER